MKKILLSFFIIFTCFNSYSQIVSPVGDTTICKGQLVTLKARKGAYIYNWNTGDLTSSITVNPKKTTTYSLRVFTSEEGAELISNHDFSKGNSGFTSDYDYVTSKGGRALWDEGKYAIGTKAKDYHAHFSACTGPSGNASERYMIVNGSPEDEAVIWSQVINVEPNKYYAFSTQACNVNPNNPAILEFRIGGVLMGDFIAPTAGQTCVWEEFHSLWHSGSNTSVEISIVNQNTIRNGNDYGLGGISFNPLVENAFERTVHVNDIVKLSLKDRYITCENNPVDLNASVSNASTVLWRTTGDGVFTNSNSVNSTYTPGTNDILNGNVTISIEATGLEGCAGATATSTIIINRNPIVDLGADRSLCSGNSLTLDAGNLGSTYLWSTGSVNQTITVNKSGIYSVQVTNANGCTSQDEVQVIVHDNPIVDLGADRSLCSGNSLTLDAGNAGSTYLWSTGSVNQTITVNKSGTYSVQVTNTNGCTSQDEVQVTVHDNPIVDLGTDRSLCSGNSLTLDAGNLGSTYLWSTGSVNQTITVNKSGTYSVQVTNANGCTSQDEVQVTVHDNPIVDLGADRSLCSGNSLTLDAGNSGSTYLWSTGSVNQTITVNKSGIYSVQVTNANGCTSQDEVQVTVHDNPIVDLGADRFLCSGNSLTLDAGNAGSTYLWSTGSVNQTITVNKSGIYSVQVTNANGCTSQDEVQVIVHDNPIVDLGTDRSLCSGNSLTLDAGNAGSTYLWSTGSVNQTITVNKSGTYSVQVTNANGCTSQDEVQVTVHDNPIVDLGADRSLCSGNSLTLDAGNAGSTYLWSTGSVNQTITVNKSGTYSVQVTNANGCTTQDEVQVTVHDNPIVDLGADRSLCSGNSLTLDAGNLGSTYLWSTGSVNQTITVNKSGTYSVQVTNANGCTSQDEVQVTVHDNPIVDLGADRSLCSGNSLTLDAGNSGSTYLWSTGSVNQTITVNKSGIYSVQVTNANGCTSQDEVQVTVHDNPIVDLGADRFLCSGNSLTLDAGNAGSTYLWSTGSVNQTITVNKSGIYSVQVTNANGCTSQDEVQVIVHDNPIVDLGTDRSLCSGNSLTLDAGNAGSTYLWSTGSVNQTITVNKSGTYSVQVTNANGCTSQDEVQVTVHDNPIVDLGADRSLCSGNSLTLDAGNAGSTYLWSTGSVNQTITVNKSGTYSVQVTNANGCTSQDEVQVTVHDNPIVDLGTDRSLCSGNSLTLDAGNLGSIYLWSTGSVNQTIIVNKSGTYSVQVTNANGCTSQDEVQVTVHDNPIVDLGSDRSLCSGNSLTLDAGNAGSTYLWSTGSVNQTITVNKSGTYSVQVTNANGCTSQDEVQVTVHDNPIVDLGADQTICLGNKVILDAGVSGNKYLWNTGETSQKIEIAEKTGMYSVTVENSRGCITKDSTFIEVIRLPSSPLEEKLDLCYGNSVKLDVGKGIRFLWNDGLTTPTRIVNKAGKYSVQIWDLNGCYGEDSIEVIVHDLPVVDLGPDLFICEGEELTLVAPDNYKVNWNPGGDVKTIKVNEAGTYILKATDEYGCTGKDEILIFVNKNPEVDLGNDTVIGEIGRASCRERVYAPV